MLLIWTECDGQAPYVTHVRPLNSISIAITRVVCVCECVCVLSTTDDSINWITMQMVLVWMNSVGLSLSDLCFLHCFGLRSRSIFLFLPSHTVHFVYEWQVKCCFCRCCRRKKCVFFRACIRFSCKPLIPAISNL